MSAETRTGGCSGFSCGCKGYDFAARLGSLLVCRCEHTQGSHHLEKQADAGGRRPIVKIPSADLLEEIDFLRGTDSWENIARRLGFEPLSLARRLHRMGEHELAGRFEQAVAA